MDLLKAWNGAVDLEKAWFTFAPPEKWLTFDYPQACSAPNKERVVFTDEAWAEAEEDERADLVVRIRRLEPREQR